MALTLACLACGPAKEAPTGTQTETTVTTATTSSAETTAMSATASEPKGEEKRSMNDYKDKVAELHTTAGEIDIRFFPDVAPNHVKNFIDLAQQGFYNGTKFRRVIPGFI